MIKCILPLTLKQADILTVALCYYIHHKGPHELFPYDTEYALELEKEILELHDIIDSLVGIDD